MDNGVDVQELPPEENQLCYFLTTEMKDAEKQQPVLGKFILKETDEVAVSYVNNDEPAYFILEEEYNTISNEDKELYTKKETPITKSVQLTDEEYDALSDEEKQTYLS